MALKKVLRTDNTTNFKFEKKGQTLEGYYVKTEQITIDGRPVAKHVFQTAAGLVGVLGQFDLGKQLAEIPPGSKVQATLMGIQKLKGGKTMKIYEVAFDEEDVLDADSIESASLEDAGDLGDAEGLEETDLDEDEKPEDVVPPARAKAPRQVATSPDSARKAKVAALLAGKSSA